MLIIQYRMQMQGRAFNTGSTERGRILHGVEVPKPETAKHCSDEANRIIKYNKSDNTTLTSWQKQSVLTEVCAY
jgi:hypothetical protein